MKKTLLTLAAVIGLATASVAQTKSSGTVALKTGTGAYSIKIDVNQTANLVTFTMIGPADNWLSLGLNDTNMSGNADCVSYNTQLHDQHMSGGYNPPATDSSNNLTLTSATTDGQNKTVIFTRPLSTSDANDYAFNYSTLNSLNIIWCEGSMTDQEHLSTAYKGTKTITFTTLGKEDFVSPLEKTAVYPNPSTGVFKITKSNDAEISKIKVFDVNAKLVKEIDADLNSSDIQVDMSGVTKGFYFLELSNGTDKTVKKVQVN